MKTFDAILPAPARDLFGFDLTQEIQANVAPGGPSTPVISAPPVWSIAMDVGSPVDDVGVASRLIGSPIFDEYKTSHLVGDMVDNAIYILTAQVTVSDGRILIQEGELACLSQRQPLATVDPGAVPFDYDAFVAAFPEFEGLSIEVGQRLWDSAGLIFRNDGSSLEPDLNVRQVLLMTLAAHLGTLYGGPGGGGSTGLVGRINSKSVNGVSVSAEGFGGITGTQQWYLTTRYGTEYWRMTAAYRTFRYFPGPTRFPNYVGRLPYGYTW